MGQIRIMDFIPMLIDLRLNETVYLIDEIDRSMHPMLSQKILNITSVTSQLTKTPNSSSLHTNQTC